MGTIYAEHIVVRGDVEQSALSGVFPRSESVVSGGWGLVRLEQRSVRSSHALFSGAIVGTSINAGLRIDGPGMVPEHARFTVRPDGVYVERVCDNAQLWVDGVCADFMPVANGSVIRLGDTLCIFVERELASHTGSVEDHGGLLLGPSQVPWLSRAVTYAQARQSFVIDGAPGVGKSALARLAFARARFSEVVVSLDARDPDVAQTLRSAVEKGTSCWLVEHFNELDRPLQQHLAHQLRRRPMSILIATLSRSLESALSDGLLAPSITAVLCGRRVSVPSLTERKDDIPSIAQSLMDQIGCGELPVSALEIIARSDWSNGIPQLRSALVQAFGQVEWDSEAAVRCLAQVAPKTAKNLPIDTAHADPALAKLRLERAMENGDHTVAGAARSLRMSRQTFYREANRLQVNLARFRAAC